jgi:uncharacterized protein
MIRNKEKRVNTTGLTAIVKPTNECNLSCKYCYLDDNKISQKMDKDTLSNVIKQTITYNNALERETRFLWHGGEPLLMDMDFWHNIVDFQKQYESKYKIKNGVQTNLTMLNTKLIDFFKQNDFAVSTSLDGPREIHDKMRIFKNGKGTYEKVIENIRILKSNDMQVGLVVVLSEESAPFIEQIYNLMMDEGLSFSVNAISPVSRAETNHAFISPKTFGQAMIKLFDLWINEKDESRINKIRVSNAEQMCEKIVLGIARKCSHSAHCSKSFIGINYNGDVFPCGTLNDKSDFRYGNINQAELKEILHCEMRYSLIRRSQNIRDDECTKCEWNNVCNSGCMSHAYAKYKDVYKKDPFCAAYKMINTHVKSKLEEILSNAEKESDKDNCYVMLDKRVNLDKIKNPALARYIEKEKIFARNLPQIHKGTPSIIYRPGHIIDFYPDYGDFYNDWSEYMEYMEYDDYYMVYQDCMVLT